MSDCEEAQDKYLEAKIAESAAEGRYQAARDQTARDKPDVTWDTVLMIGCFIGSGILVASVIASPMGTLMIVSCGTISVGDALRQHNRYEEDQQREQEARKALDEARKRSADAQKARTKACQKPKGCGSHGGPGYRRPSGKCAAWSDGAQHAAYA